MFAFLKPKSAIYVVNRATVVSDAMVKTWCSAVQKQIKQDVAPAWGRPAKSVVFVKSENLAPRNSWVIVVMDDADQQGVLGYHSVDDAGRVYGRVFAKTAKDYGESASVTFSHEVLETYRDPSADEWAKPTLSRWETPLELCDAVEGDSYLINRVAVSNFLYPAWFQTGRTAPFDHMRTARAPFMLAPRGYIVRRFPDGHTDEIFGERANIDHITAKASSLGRTARRRA